MKKILLLISLLASFSIYSQTKSKSDSLNIKISKTQLITFKSMNEMLPGEQAEDLRSSVEMIGKVKDQIKVVVFKGDHFTEQALNFLKKVDIGSKIHMNYRRTGETKVKAYTILITN